MLSVVVGGGKRGGGGRENIIIKIKAVTMNSINLDLHTKPTAVLMKVIFTC